jgi:hypothetical protein
MAKFRKKPVIIEASQFIVGNRYPQWIHEAIVRGDVWMQGGESPYLTIKTLEGEMRAEVGDWIIKGVNGELYPCKPDIFDKTYEYVDA